MRFAGMVFAGAPFASTVAAVLLAGLAVPAAAQTVKDGVDAWQRADYDAAVRAWRPLAGAGDGDAAFDMAQAYKLGRGVPLDLAKAKTYYGQAARAGHVQGAANYGLLLFQDGDRKAAMPWIVKAADDGDPRAQYVYGTALFNGDLLPKDWPHAYALMTRAAAAGLPQATTSLAQMDQFIPAGDRQQGVQLASQLASRPVPPLGKTLVTGGGAAYSETPPGQIATTMLPPSSPVTQHAAARPTPLLPVRTPPHPLARQSPPPPPAAAVKETAAAPVRTGGAWMVQLGAYGSDAGAKAAWGKVAGKLAGLSPRYEKAGAVVRLRVAGLADRAAAEHACAAAKSAGAACFPVAP